MAETEAEQGANRAFEARDTQDASKSDGGYVYKPNERAERVGESISDQGNEFALKNSEAGRDDEAEEEQGAGRKSAPSTARFSTGVAPSGPIDEDSPHIPTP